MTKTYTFEIAFRGRTETMEFSGFGEDPQSINNFDALVCKIGRGEKVYRAFVSAWRIDRMHENSRKNYGGRTGNPVVVDADGVEWGVNLTNTTVRNRQAYIVGWADDFVGTAAANRYSDYSAIS